MRTNKPRFSHVIFDLDGTILNTLEDLADSCNWVCARHGWPTHGLDKYRYFVGSGMVKLLERATPPQAQVSPLKEQVLEEFMDYYGAHKADKTRPYAGMSETLETLRGAGVTTAVLTNKPDQAANAVVEQYYPGLFSVVQGALPGVPVKPDPTLLRRLMERIGAVPERTLYVGDSDVDIQTAKNGGLTSCGVLWGFRTQAELEGEGADHIARTPTELLNIIFGT